MRCNPRLFIFPLWLVSQNLIIDLVLVGVMISDMIENMCCTQVVANFKHSDVCFPIYSVLALCFSSISDSGSVFSFKLVIMAIPIWLTCLHFDYVKLTDFIVMCVDWSIYEWNLCLVVCFHSVDRLFALLCFDNGSFGRILDLSFILYVEIHMYCSCAIHWPISLLSWHYVECSIRWWVVLDCFLGYCWVWQCNDQMDNGIPFFMTIPICWKIDCDLFCLVSFGRYWLGWIFFWFRTKGGVLSNGLSLLGCIF